MEISKSQRTQREGDWDHPRSMALRAVALALLCFQVSGLSGQEASKSRAASPAAKSSVSRSTMPSAAQPVRVVAYNEKQQRTGTGWALPINGGYVVARSLLANSTRAELEFTDEMRSVIEAVAGEDVEANLVLVFSGSAPEKEIEVSNAVTLVSDDLTPSASPMRIECGGESYILNDKVVRDIPVFGLVYLGRTGHREPISGCPMRDGNGAVQALVVWDNPFGHPSAALLPASRMAKLQEEPRTNWETWRTAQMEPSRRLRNSLISEALQDIWRGDYSLANESLTWLLENNPEDARGWFYRGYARAMSGKRQLAILDYEASVRFDPANAEARFSLGFSYALMRRLDEAREQIEALEPLDEALADRLRLLVDAMAPDEDAEHPESSEGATAPPAESTPAENTPAQNTPGEQPTP